MATIYNDKKKFRKADMFEVPPAQSIAMPLFPSRFLDFCEFFLNIKRQIWRIRYVLCF